MKNAASEPEVAVMQVAPAASLAVSVGLAYAVMAQVDALGALSAKLGLGGVSSSLFYLWFAALPVPVAALCRRFGATRLVRAALGALVAGGLRRLPSGGSCGRPPRRREVPL